MSDTVLLRIGIAIALSLLFGAIIYFGRGRKAGQGRRIPREPSVDADGRADAATHAAPRLVGTFGRFDRVQPHLRTPQCLLRRWLPPP